MHKIEGKSTLFNSDVDTDNLRATRKKLFNSQRVGDYRYIIRNTDHVIMNVLYKNSVLEKNSKQCEDYTELLFYGFIAIKTTHNSTSCKFEAFKNSLVLKSLYEEATEREVKMEWIFG